MYTLETVTGFLGGLLFLVCFALSYKILQSFEEDEELAATKIFLKGSIVNSLRVLVAGTLFFGVTGLVTFLTITYDGNSLFANSYRAGTIVLFLSYFYMISNIYRSTR